MNNMKISIDNRSRNSNYTDSINNHYASNKDIIKMINNNTFDINRTIADIICITHNVSYEAANVLYLIYNIIKDNKCNRINLREDYKYYYEKSRTTFDRALNELIAVNIISINDKTKDIILTKNYILPEDKDNAKFLVIEINPKVTSKEVTI